MELLHITQHECSLSWQDSTLTASILSSSTPRHPTYGFPGTVRSPSAGRAGSGRPLIAQMAFSSGGVGAAAAYQQRRPQSAQQQDLDLSLAGLEESECETLPFALDSEASPRRQPSAGPAGGSADDESDVAVGAFVRLIEHAPPLNAVRGAAGLSRSRIVGGGLPNVAGGPAGINLSEAGEASGDSGTAEGLTLAAGLSQLAKLRAQLEPISA